MTITVDMGRNRAIELDAVKTTMSMPAVLLSLAGDVHGKVQNCSLIPLSRLDDLIAALQLMRTELRA